MCARVPFLIVALNLIEEGLRRSIGSLFDPRIPRDFEPCVVFFIIAINLNNNVPR